MSHSFIKISLFVFILAVSFYISPVSAQSISTGCGNDMNHRHKIFLNELGKKNFYSQASSNDEASEKLIVWLQEVNTRVVKHENAHKNTAGKWAGKITYLTFEWWGIKYATAGCVPYKSGIPLNTLIRAQLAPDQPSEHDRRSALKAQNYIKIKLARAGCHKIRMKNYSAGEKCLKPYKSYRWLDRYPMN